jgi:hypothetical protein
MEAAAQQGMSAAQQKAVGEMIDAASDRIAQTVVAGLEERVKSLETALEKSQRENKDYFAARDMTMLETMENRDVVMLGKINLMLETVQNNIAMQMTDMQGAIEQIREKDMDVSTDDGLYSDDEADEDKGAVSYDEVEALCKVQDTGEDERQFFHMQAVERAAVTGQLCEGELQACFKWRAERDQEKQWAQNEGQRGLEAMGSPVAVETFVAEAQRVANAITNEALEKQYAAAQEQLQENIAQAKQMEELKWRIQSQQKNIAETAKGKKRAAGEAAERDGKAGKPTKKGQHLLPQKNSRRGAALGWH